MDYATRAWEMSTLLLCSVNLKESDYLRNPDLDRRIILKLILNTSSGSVLTDLYGWVLNQRWTIANQTIGLGLLFKMDTSLCSRATVGSLRTTLFQGLKIITLKSMTRRIMSARVLDTRTQGHYSPNMRGAHNSGRWLLTGNHAQQPSLWLNVTPWRHCSQNPFAGAHESFRTVTPEYNCLSVIGPHSCTKSFVV